MNKTNKIMEYSVNRKAVGKIKIILQLDPETKEVINEFYSVRKAASGIGKPNFYSWIAKACKTGELCCGYYWRYEKLE